MGHQGSWLNDAGHIGDSDSTSDSGGLTSTDSSSSTGSGDDTSSFEEAFNTNVESSGSSIAAESADGDSGTSSFEETFNADVESSGNSVAAESADGDSGSTGGLTSDQASKEVMDAYGVSDAEQKAVSDSDPSTTVETAPDNPTAPSSIGGTTNVAKQNKPKNSGAAGQFDQKTIAVAVVVLIGLATVAS